MTPRHVAWLKALHRDQREASSPRVLAGDCCTALVRNPSDRALAYALSDRVAVPIIVD